MNLTFANGTSQVAPIFATRKFRNDSDYEIRDAQDFYKVVVAPLPVDLSPPTILNSSKILRITGMRCSTKRFMTHGDAGEFPYPSDPVVNRDRYVSEISGYFMNNTSTAVPSITSFEADEGRTALAFQKTVAEFLAKSKQAGMNKLVVDLQGNPGGLGLLGTDVFKQVGICWSLLR